MKTILSVMLLCTSVSSFAAAFGTPDQDPVVKYARQLFDDGEKPSMNFLLNNKFQCTNLSAVKNNFKKEIMSDEVAFEKTGPFLSIEDNEEVVFTDNGDEFVTAIDSDEGLNYVSLRMESDTKTLVMERSMPLVDKSEEAASKYVKALADVNQEDEAAIVVIEYSVCHRI